MIKWLLALQFMELRKEGGTYEVSVRGIQPIIRPVSHDIILEGLQSRVCPLKNIHQSSTSTFH